MRRRIDQAAYFQLGDLLWRIYHLRNGFDDARDLHLWCDDRGEIAGFVFYHSPDDNPEFFLRPERYDADAVYVRTYKDNLPAVGLYQKVGFRITHEDHGWRRSVRR
jgi:hypothetical protein